MRQVLRVPIAVRSETFAELFGGTDVMEFRTKISQIIVVCDYLVEPVDFRQFYRLVIRDFGLRCLNLKSRIPGAAVGAVETAALRMCMTERGVNDPKIRHPEDKFMDADSGQQIVFCKQPVIGGIVEVEDVLQMRIIIGDAHKNTVAPLAAFREDQAMCIVLADKDL